MLQGWQQQLAPVDYDASNGNGIDKGTAHTHQEQPAKEYGSDLPFKSTPADRSAHDVVLALCGGTAVNGAMPAEDRQDTCPSSWENLFLHVHAVPTQRLLCSEGKHA